MTNDTIEGSLRSDDRLLIAKLRVSLDRGSFPSLAESENIHRAAVCVFFNASSEGLKVLLVKRMEKSEDPWSGHMAFPGGKRKKEDLDDLATAVREVYEETGINIRKAEILGVLNEVIPSTLLSIKVVPFVAFAPGLVTVHANEEIQRFFWIPVSYFLDQRNVTRFRVNRFGLEADVPCYRYLGENVIWGLTFRIIQDLLSRLERAGIAHSL